MPRLILGSSSPFRRELLEKLDLSFECDSPDIDETPLKNEKPEDMVARLAKAKAMAIAERNPQSIIIASDQCATLDGEIIGKPGDHENAVAQLQKASGRCVTFYTSLCVYNGQNEVSEEIVEPFYVYFRELNDQQIENYLQKEQPYNCAGSFKSEGLGISLFDRLEGSDPNTLIGLPLIQLIRMLEKFHIKVI
ncbi:septum formation inhibitor Maf [Bermanella marisrubri]|uniref:7-methyl-GTP pyrophosphatase n=1 Tax=Bermanella marisrubri TaxID=207949 RepID=Q1N1M7_9GAMM|nr:Maf family nucleotide pyrophosphatase [Bermanella marisrubri]EAT12023.1 septum formation protein Maf [Oceanobacter sp. RED65] [Bermanella marisrubri]QIZ83496.1 septum formation inhibitor Maf [Bermanella marisrubri]